MTDTDALYDVRERTGNPTAESSETDSCRQNVDGQALCNPKPLLVAEHPFVDENTRTALRTVVVFYMLNGYTFDYGDEIRALLHRFATDEAAVDTDTEVRRSHGPPRPWYFTHPHLRDSRRQTVLSQGTGTHVITGVQDTTAAVEAELDNLGTVDDPDLQEQYAAEARRMKEGHDPDDVI